MSRYRLRFLLQEFDLRASEVILGRSSDCHVTIEDPLVSRNHARIITEPTPFVEDLGSRNGVKVNGRPVQSRTELRDGDRIRIGTQELVFSVVRSKKRDLRPTGFMRNCRSCQTPYPEGASRCPHCGVPVIQEEDEATLSGLAVEPNRSWTFQLLGDVISRAISSGRSGEADKLLGRAAGEVDAQIRQGLPIESSQLASLTCLAIDLAEQQGASKWLEWTLDVYQQIGHCPPGQVIDALGRMKLLQQAPVRKLVGDLVRFLERQPQSRNAEEAQRLQGLRGLADG